MSGSKDLYRLVGQVLYPAGYSQRMRFCSGALPVIHSLYFSGDMQGYCLKHASALDHRNNFFEVLLVGLIKLIVLAAVYIQYTGNDTVFYQGHYDF